MEPALRGGVEKIIDITLEEDSLRKKAQIFKYYKNEGIISSIESALFGSIWTNIITVLVDVKNRQKKEISESEMEEFEHILASRAIEIKSKISEIANL